MRNSINSNPVREEMRGERIEKFFHISSKLKALSDDVIDQVCHNAGYLLISVITTADNGFTAEVVKSQR